MSEKTKLPAERPLDISNLPKLTPKQQKWVLLVIEGATFTEAYRQAYDTSGMAEATLHREASALSRHHNISMWLLEAEKRRAERLSAALSPELIIAALWRNREEAADSRQYSAANRALELVGKHLGMWDETRPNGGLDAFENATLADLERMLAKLERFQAKLPVAGESKVIDQQ